MFNDLLRQIEAIELSIEIGKLFVDKNMESIEEALAMHLAFLLRKGFIKDREKFIKDVEIIMEKMKFSNSLEEVFQKISH